MAAGIVVVASDAIVAAVVVLTTVLVLAAALAVRAAVATIGVYTAVVGAAPRVTDADDTSRFAVDVRVKLLE